MSPARRNTGNALDSARGQSALRAQPDRGSLHLGSALTAVANRRFADERCGVLALRIDDTDVARVDPEAEAGILRDLEWLGVVWDEGPLRQSERRRSLPRCRRAAARGGSCVRRSRCGQVPGRAQCDAAAAGRQRHVPPRLGGRRHRARDHARHPGPRPPAEHRAPPGAGTRARCGAARVRPPRAPGRSGRPEALEAPRRRLRGRPPRARGSRRRPCAPTSRSSTFRATTSSSISPGSGGCRSTRSRPCPTRSSAPESALRSGSPPPCAGARTLAEARDIAASDSRSGRRRPSSTSAGGLRAERFRELRERVPGELDAGSRRATLLRELKAVGGDLRSLRLVLTGVSSGPELWAVLVALTREEALRPRRAPRSAPISILDSAPLQLAFAAARRSCRLRPARSACTSAARRSTSGSTSATRGRSSSRCGCGTG